MALRKESKREHPNGEGVGWRNDEYSDRSIWVGRRYGQEYRRVEW